MPKYTSHDRVKSGVPLGGIGAGKMEIMPNGAINFITFQNNWSEPIKGPATGGVLGFYFGIFTECEGIRVAKFLQTNKINGFPLVEKVEYEGSFPFARLKYIDRKLPLKVELLAHSSFIPKNNKDSSLPGAFFTFKFKNPTKKKIAASLLIIGRNTVGNWGVGRFNVVTKDRRLTHLSFKNKRKEPIRNDFLLGDMTISVPREAGEITYLGEWNFHGECFALKEHTMKLDAWDCFYREGRLPNINTKRIVESESQELGGGLAVKFDIEPGKTKEITLTYSWFFPLHTIGHIYTRWFKNSIDVSKYLFREKKRLYSATKRWHDKLTSNGLPPWLSDALANNLYPLISSTWYGKDGSFVGYEAPLACPLMGTVDVRFYGSIPLGLLFPDLELNIMKRFAQAQRKDGYIPHDLGRRRIDLPSDGTTYYKWKDLCSKFVLLCYRDYLLTKDKAFLKKVYPNIKRAMEWEFAQDRNRDFLPDNEGQDQTFDMWKFYSTNSYTAGIFLAALLACIKIAKIFGDKRSEERYKSWFKKGRESFEKKLWNRKYFSNYVCTDKGGEDSCTTAQLNGQWYAHLLGLGYIADKHKIRKAIRSILRLNSKKSPYGPVSSVFQDGTLNRVNLHSWNIFPGMGYALVSLCIYEGFVKEGLELAKRIWDNFVHNTKTPWNQSDLVSYRTGKMIFGDYYMRNMAIWSVLLALAKKNKSARKTLRAVIK